MLTQSVALGTFLGAAVALAFALWGLAPASREMRRGYFNAFVTGLLLAAAVEVLPNALAAAELAARSLLAPRLPTGAGETNFWSVILQPAQLQLAVRSFGAAVVMLVFFRANGARLQTAPQPGETGARRLFLLPTAGTDYVGLAVLLAGLLGYALWIGLSRGFSPGSRGAFSFDVLALAFICSLLGVAAIGLIADFRKQGWLLPVACLLLGLAAGLGAVDTGEGLALEVALLPLLVSALCLVFAIGRLLRLLQHEIGLGWQTTLTVAVGALCLYQSRLIF